MRLTVLGTGYLGAVHAACMADLGHEVLGVDVDPRKVELLSSGRSPFFEPGLDEVLSRAVESGRLRFSTSLAEAAEFGDVHFVCVGTPQKPGSGAADLSHIDAVVDGLAPHLHRETLIVGKSTVPVGTAQRMAARIAELAPVGDARRARLEPGVPPRGLRGAGHDAAGPHRRRRHLPASRGRPQGGLRHRARRRHPVGLHRPAPPPSWSRSRRTPSSPPRSRSSTRSPRSATPAARTSSPWPRRSATTSASATASSTPASASAAAACPRTSGRSRHVPASWACPGSSSSCARSTRSTWDAASARPSSRGRCSAGRCSAATWPCSAAPSSRTATTSATPPP